MINPGQVAYYAKEKGSVKPLGRAHNFKSPPKKKIALLWGDPLYVFKMHADGNADVSAKGHHLRLPVADLREDALLSVYQIDCGQGDAALVHFPNGKWMMIDGGPARGDSNSGRIAADFLYWKMFVDQSWRFEFGLTKKPFKIDAVVCTHPDYDHYGGFLDMTRYVKSGQLAYGNVFHGGLGRFKGTTKKLSNGHGFGQLGPVAGNRSPEYFVTTLIDDFADVRKYAKTSANRDWKLSGYYAAWLEDLEKLEGSGVGRLRRVFHGMGYLPGYGETTSVPVKILGPVEEAHDGMPALRHLDGASRSALASPSLTRNGQSVVLRLDHDRVRILMTGDLNFKSQAVLLRHVAEEEFRCHVAKACHHGSEDVSSTFLNAMSPYATMFSSGDNEKYAHPRARILGMTGAMSDIHVIGGTKRFLGLEERRHVAPLIYSTELSRSVEIWDVYSVFDGEDRIEGADIQAKGRTESTADSGRRQKARDWLLADKMIYGLINVRTDGRKVVIGVMKEQEDAGFQVESFTVP